MTECQNAEFRDLLPDYVAENLDASVSATIAEHLASCSACEAEVVLLRIARAVRPQAVHVDVERIVARLVSSTGSGALVSPIIDVAAGTAETDIASPAVVSMIAARSRRSNRGMWQIAAAVGVVALGSLSLLTARSGLVGLPIAARSDTARLGEAAERALSAVPQAAQAIAPTATDTAVGSNTTAPASGDGSNASPSKSSDAQGVGSGKARAAVVSVGDLSDYTDAELQKLLDRLERWDGASSSEVMPSVPLVRVGERGAGE